MGLGEVKYSSDRGPIFMVGEEDGGGLFPALDECFPLPIRLSD